MKSTVDDLFNEVKLGRGLWVGLFPEYSEDLLVSRQTILEQNSDCFSEVTEPTKLHVTLAHLGKNASLKQVFDAHAAMESTASVNVGDIVAGMTGVLRLKRHVAIALVPDAIMSIRDRLFGAFVDRLISWDKTFPMMPHMSLGKLAYEREMPRCPAIVERALVFRSLTMVCGDVRLHAPFSNWPF